MVTFWNQNKILIGFFLLLTAVTVYGFFDQSEIEQKELTAKVSAELLKNAQGSSTRTLASVQEKPAVTTAKKIKVFCDSSPIKMNSDKSLLMLEVSSCRELYGKHQIWIKNVTNGFKAQVFKTGDLKFKTDFMQLTSGSNKIEIEGILKDGQKVVQTLEIQSGS